MQGLTCDGCQKSLLVEEDVRYVVQIQVYAAYDPMELTPEDLEQVPAQAQRLYEKLEELDPELAQDQIYRDYRYDLCPPCQRAYLKRPLAGAQAGN